MFENQLIQDDKFGVVKPTDDNNITIYVFPLKSYSEFTETFLEFPDEVKG